MLPRKFRLTATYQFRRIKRYGQTYAGRSFLASYLYDLKSPEDLPQFGFIISKSFDKRAAERNRVKRKLSEAVYSFLLSHQEGVAGRKVRVSLVARRPIVNATYENLSSEIDQVLSKVFEL